MPPFKKGDRVVVDQPTLTIKGVEEPYSWHGKRGVVVRAPGEEATDGYGPSSSYAVHFDGEKWPSAPFRDETMDPAYHSLIVAEEDA